MHINPVTWLPLHFSLKKQLYDFYDKFYFKT